MKLNVDRQADGQTNTLLLNLLAHARGGLINYYLQLEEHELQTN